MIGGMMTALFLAVAVLVIRIHCLKDQISMTEMELNEAIDERDRALKENLYWRGSKELICNYKEMAEHFQSGWETKTEELAELKAENKAREKWRDPYTETCVKYYERHNKTVDDLDSQPKDKDGNYTNEEGVSKDRKRQDAYLLWKAKGFPNEEEWPGIYEEIGKSLKLKGTTVKQYIREYVRGDGRYHYNSDRQEAEKEKIATLPQAQ